MWRKALTATGGKQRITRATSRSRLRTYWGINRTGLSAYVRPRCPIVRGSILRQPVGLTCLDSLPSDSADGLGVTVMISEDALLGEGRGLSSVPNVKLGVQLA